MTSRQSTACCSSVGPPPPVPPAAGRRPADESVAADVALGLLRIYKVLLSPLFTGSCRYLPSCSDYAAEAIRGHGAVRGAWMALLRLARCHPWGGSGLDPVPPARHRATPGTPGREPTTADW